MKKIACVFLLAAAMTTANAQKGIKLTSPNGDITTEIKLTDKIYYSVLCKNDTLLRDNSLGLELDNRVLGDRPKLIGKKEQQIKEQLKPIVPLKFSTIDNVYNQLVLRFKDQYAVEFRAYDDGIAYRIITDIRDSINVVSEEMNINFTSENLLHVQQPGGFKTAYEEIYTHINSTEWKPNGKMAVLPMLIDTKKPYKILVSESDLSDYPCMFLKSSGRNGITATFPKVPVRFGEDGDRSVKILEEAEYIARTTGQRSFPWRYFVVSKQDTELLTNTMTYRLATKNVLADASWIKPGQASWEWWNGAKPYGPDVDFVSGYNLDTYKYFIDFAHKFGMQYIIMDEGWAKSTRDPYTPNPDVDVHEIIKYGKERNVGVFLWLTWLTVEKNLGLFEQFASWGVKGVKIDFMDRSDQWMVNYYERIAKEAAKHNLLVDFHGSFKPAGLEYKYPNVISYEGVRGMEQMGGCYPNNSVYLPFIRNAVGPMDYTPGAMISMQPNVYRSERPNSASIGTRAYQMSLFVIFESGIQMLADNPTQYYRNEECTDFITNVPTTWDETIALNAKVGEHVIVAKRKGEKWYIGGMTNSEEDWRNFQQKLTFLTAGKTYKMTSFKDGINAVEQAMDYRKEVAEVTVHSSIEIKLAKSGGFAAVLEPVTE
ncbi:glycoside hydrolase family 97 protein [Sphingobacterium sp. SGR-19]|uniref:glycoside hydrolase family 97 protein n=1 Tax=Sphingobacterium sp. SGR-19 TaxID=2710886 RepID=UPI0013EACBD7|nr:glycoside hydrolase family 97 protein [Sphingobacterium sp. SGR-19]NGM67353.1 glycoside hydrolase family 97 protein [Sphingobacterium sp. SGR-19]